MAIRVPCTAKNSENLIIGTDRKLRSKFLGVTILEQQAVAGATLQKCQLQRSPTAVTKTSCAMILVF